MCFVFDYVLCVISGFNWSIFINSYGIMKTTLFSLLLSITSLSLLALLLRSLGTAFQWLSVHFAGHR
ncbi:MAG: Uncharacterised protein [Rhodothermaeota bacterium MED-G12]|nr:MAG: Uncharacterised protein [Rhodothermaeota bacterium MED-G12]